MGDEEGLVVVDVMGLGILVVPNIPLILPVGMSARIVAALVCLI